MGELATTKYFKDKNIINGAANLDLHSLIPLIDLLEKRREIARKCLSEPTNNNDKHYLEILDKYNETIRQLIHI